MTAKPDGAPSYRGESGTIGSENKKSLLPKKYFSVSVDAVDGGDAADVFEL